MPEILTGHGLRRPLIFFGFFVFTALAFALRSLPYARETYVASTVAVLLVVNVVGMGGLLPFVDYHKYTSAQNENYYYQHVTVEDVSGNEIRYDNRAIEPASVNTMYRQLDDDDIDVATVYLLERAIEHREDVERGEYDGLEQLRFPPPSLTHTWSVDDLEEMDEFVAVNVYQTHVMYEDENHDIQEIDHDLRYQATVDDLDSDTKDVEVTV